VVGGPVSSPDLGKRAESIVRRVPGIVDVRNRCFVQDIPDPLLRAVSARPSTPQPAANLPGVVASPKTGLVEEYTPTLGPTTLAAVEPTEKSVVARRPANPGDSVLLPPVGAATSTALKAAPPPAPAAVLIGRTADAMAAAESIRKTDRRFAGLSIAFANGTFVIAGSAAKAADAWDLAQELRRIPGVPRVAVGAVDVK